MQKERFLILIGGAPTTGKSYLAKKLAKELEISWISTDQIRSLAQNIIAEYNDDSYADLLLAKKVGAENYYGQFTAKQIAEQEIKESELTFKFLKYFVHEPYPWKSFIIEGVNILPELIVQIQNEKIFEGKIIPVFLVDEDVDRARKVIYERGLWGPAKSYSDDVKEKEVEWVFEFSKILKEKCLENNVDYFEVSKNDEDLDKIITEIKKQI